MALYRTERRLNWHHNLQIGHWYAPWSEVQADTGTDYFSRTLRWLRHSHPKATVAADSHALPEVNAGWPEGRFGLPLASDTAADASAANEPDSTGQPQTTPHAGDLLLVEWPQPLATGDTATTQADTTGNSGNASDSPALPPLWINGLERALRRNWQDNPLCEVILVGGTTGICKQGVALGAHYGITVLDPMSLLRPDCATAPDHSKALIREGKTGAPCALTLQGQEIWAGMLISLLREQVRYGPTPDPVSLPNGLWCR